MSIKIMTSVWENGPKKQSDRFVLLALADHANDSGDCYPSIKKLCLKTCMSERGIQTILRRLEHEKWLHISYGVGRNNCNLYTIRIPETPQEMHPAGGAPPHIKAETPQMDAINPAGYAPEPSYNHSETSIVRTMRPKKPKRSQPITDEYLDGLQEKYTWVQVKQEFTKAMAWCEVRGFVLSRERFVNWINRASPPPQVKIKQEQVYQ